MVIDPVLPDGHGVAPPANRLDDQLAVGSQALTRSARVGRSPAAGVAVPVTVSTAGSADESVDTCAEMDLTAGCEGGHGPAPAARRP